MKSVFKKGFKAVKEEEKRREEARKARQGKLWRLFFPKDADEDYEIPFRFLTDEPICYYEHTKKINGRPVNFTCTGEDCEHCDGEDKPRFVGAFLGIDRTEFTVDEKDDKGNKTGKKKKVKDRVKLLVRGQTDLAQLDRLKNKYGLLDRDWSIYKTGKDTSTKWNFDRGEVEEWSEEEILDLLPENLRKIVEEADSFSEGLYQIVIDQIQNTEEDSNSSGDSGDDEDVKGKASKGVQRIEEDDEDDDSEDDSEEDSSKHKSKLNRNKNKKLKKR